MVRHQLLKVVVADCLGSSAGPVGRLKERGNFFVVITTSGCSHEFEELERVESLHSQKKNPLSASAMIVDSQPLSKMSSIVVQKTRDH